MSFSKTGSKSSASGKRHLDITRRKQFVPGLGGSWEEWGWVGHQHIQGTRAGIKHGKPYHREIAGADTTCLEKGGILLAQVSHLYFFYYFFFLFNIYFFYLFFLMGAIYGSRPTRGWFPVPCRVVWADFLFFFVKGSSWRKQQKETTHYLWL